MLKNINMDMFLDFWLLLVDIFFKEKKLFNLRNNLMVDVKILLKIKIEIEWVLFYILLEKFMLIL